MYFYLSTKNCLRLLISCAVVGFFSRGIEVKAQNVCADIKLDSSQSLKFSKMQLWLDHLEAEKGNFSQIDQKGKSATGKFALQRPNDMRFDYDGKNGIHIIGSEGKIAYTDPSVGQVTFLPMDKTPLGLLFGKSYGWESICLQKFNEDSQFLSATLTQKNNPSQGNITLKFMKDPLHLSGWRIEDMQGNITEIVLDQIKEVKGFSSHYFKLPKES
ncbi:outer membrane lipoprotein carrier protein LolA [Acetobacteraceae bacterium]|nr:outer membrane lipoprotein carrier protein LolA [Acetobacteraceae bacterium]